MEEQILEINGYIVSGELSQYHGNGQLKETMVYKDGRLIV